MIPLSFTLLALCSAPQEPITYDLAYHELNRYLNAEKHELVQGVENLWDKYAVSSRELEDERGQTLTTLGGFLKGLGYVF